MMKTLSEKSYLNDKYIGYIVTFFRGKNYQTRNRDELQITPNDVKESQLYQIGIIHLNQLKS